MELYLPLSLEAQVISHLHPVTFYQNVGLDFKLERTSENTCSSPVSLDW